jgi:hypothetical protein
MSIEVQYNLAKSRPGFLSEIVSHNDFLQTVHQPHPEELQQFQYVLGDGFTFELAQLHAPLYVFNNESNLGTLHIDDKDHGSKTHLPFHRYTRTNFATILDGWVVFINTYQARSPKKVQQKKAARFDFMLLNDWMDSEVTSREAGTKTLSPDAHSNGLFTRGSSLLRTLRHLLLSVPEDCRIDVHAANEEREHLYRKMFANKPNIIMHINQEDRSSLLKLLKRKLADLNAR